MQPGQQLTRSEQYIKRQEVGDAEAGPEQGGRLTAPSLDEPFVELLEIVFFGIKQLVERLVFLIGDHIVQIAVAITNATMVDQQSVGARYSLLEFVDVARRKYDFGGRRGQVPL